MGNQCKYLYALKNAVSNTYYKGMLNAGWDCNNESVKQYGSCRNIVLFGIYSSVLLAVYKGILHTCKEGSSQKTIA